jgi:hypothetical protein
VLAVDRVECTDTARRCSPRESPRGISMLGIGFARRGDHQAQSGPAKNPFLNAPPSTAPRRSACGAAISSPGAASSLG